MTDESQKFLLDANVLISAHRSYYAFDICPGFWDAVIAGHAEGRIFSTQRVLAELRRGGDALLAWAEAELPEGFFMDDSELEVNFSENRLELYATDIEADTFVEESFDMADWDGAIGEIRPQLQR